MKTVAQGEAQSALVRLGLNELEALVYCELLKQPGATGYAIGNALNRAHANVYQTLVALEAKGAVAIEDGKARKYTAMPAESFVDKVRDDLNKQCDVAKEALSRIELAPDDEDRFYRLQRSEQVLERARQLIGDAEETVLIQMFPGPSAELRETLVAAHKRGIRIAGIVLREEDLIEGTNCRVSLIADRVLDRWKYEVLNLVVDGRQFLLALFEVGTLAVRKAVWANSVFASSILHNGIVADSILHASPIIREIGSPSTFLFDGMPPGFRELQSP